MQQNIKDMINADYKAPDIDGIYEWINGQGFSTLNNLRGKVVIIDFWTYSCVNCIRTFPYLNHWYKEYKDFGLEIIGIHTPEFDFEHNINNVKNAVQRYGIKYLVGLDNNYQTWRNYTNLYWPAKYIIDRKGVVRFTYFGEGNYEQIDQILQFLIAEDNPSLTISDLNMLKDIESGEVDFDKISTSETYLGMDRMKTSRFFNAHDAIFINPVAGSFLGSDNESILSKPMNYQKPYNYDTLNTWWLDGTWQFSSQYLELIMGKGRLGIKFKSKSVNLVCGIGEGKEVSATVYLNGVSISNEHAGKDVKNGKIFITENMLYNIVNQNEYKESLLEIEFNDPGAKLYAFTFG